LDNPPDILLVTSRFVAGANETILEDVALRHNGKFVNFILFIKISI